MTTIHAEVVLKRTFPEQAGRSLRFGRAKFLQDAVWTENTEGERKQNFSFL